MSRDERRLEELATVCGPRVLGYLTRRVAPREDAADIYQQVLVTTWRKIDSVPDIDAQALGWMLAVARRTLANHRRSTSRRLAATDRLADELKATEGVTRSAGEHPASAFGDGANDATDAVRAALADLTDGDREVLTLTYWDGLTGEQIALVLGVRPAAVRKRLERARSRLTARLAEQGDDLNARADLAARR